MLSLFIFSLIAGTLCLKTLLIKMRGMGQQL